MIPCADYDLEAREPCQSPATETTPAGRDLCARHADSFWETREQALSDYPDSDVPPSWFDPSYAGETWGE